MLHLRELQVLRCVVLFIETERLWENWLITKTTFPPLDATCPARAWLQLFHQMGPDPVPEPHRGVELIIRSDTWMAGRQHSKKHSQNTIFT